ncbi:MAG: hypothetical protein ABH836_04410 [Candidatus Omnitrophota bacterium]
MKEKYVFKIEDIARTAKVSSATALRVLKGLACEKEESCQRVLDAIKELSGKSKISIGVPFLGRSYTLGIAVPYFGKMFSSFYEMQVLKGADTSYRSLDALKDGGIQTQLSYSKFLLFKLFGLY